MSDPLPSKFALRFLKWFCPDHLFEEIEGDLVQRFGRDLRQFNARKARRRFIWNTLRFFRPGIILRNKRSRFKPLNYMISNYLKVASRVMLRNKSYSAINISGLTLGISAAILLFLWIEKEFTYDQFHADKDRIYHAWNLEQVKNDIRCWSTTPRVLAPTLKAEYPTVEDAVSYGFYSSSHLFTVGETRIVKETGAFTDPGFLKMFSFPMLKGDPAKALSNPNSIVLTETFAKQLFGDKEPFGETVNLGESGYTFPFTVTGILKDLPSNTDFNFDYLITFQFMESLGEKDTFWGNNSVDTYVKLQKEEDINEFNEKVKDVARKHTKPDNQVEIFLYPLTKMHLYAQFENGVPTGGRIKIIRMLGILGVCLVVIACINFVNLSTARAQKRSKEIGIRKVTGAYRQALVIQFLCESVLIAFVAGVLSLGIAYVVLPWFSTLVQQQLTLDFERLSFWLLAFSFIVFVGILAGTYPALYLSSFHPVRILKGGSVSAGSRGRLRQMLVVFQFGFAITLIVSVIVISKQVRFVQEREVGYVKDNLIYLTLTGDLEKNYEAFKNDLLNSGVATSVTRTSSPMTDRMSNTSEIRWNGKDPQEKTNIERFYFDGNISGTTGVTILEGRDLDLQKYPGDNKAVLLNEASVKLMGFKEPIGEVITDGDTEWQVVGVIKDFILTSPYQKVGPIVFFGSTKWCYVVHIKMNSKNTTQQNIATISELFEKHNPAYPFDYRFVDDEYNRKFASLETTLTITTLFGSIAIFIACLGLLGLSSFMIESRIKEIGIRKVLGGSVTSVVRLLSFNMVKPILIGIVLFSPGAWFAMNWWLQSFDYRISMNIWMLFLAGISILVIALMTIAIQTFAAASANPVKSLRTE